MDKYAVGPSKSATITDIKTLMSNPDDADDEKINNYLYEISLATRDLVKDRVFNQTIIGLAQSSETQSANLFGTRDGCTSIFQCNQCQAGVEKLIT